MIPYSSYWTRVERRLAIRNPYPRRDVHSHGCEWCGRTWVCRGGDTCQLGPREGFCDERCEQKLTRLFIPPNRPNKSPGLSGAGSGHPDVR